MKYRSVINKDRRKAEERKMEVMKTKKELIEETFGYTKQQASEFLTQTLDDKHLKWWKFVLYLYGDTVSKEKFELLKQNGDFLVKNWEDMRKVIKEINTEEFEEYPEIQKYYKMWCNSLIGEYYFFHVGNGNVMEGRKLAKKLFIKFELSDFEKETPERLKPRPQIDGGYYSHQYTSEQLKMMRHLLKEGYPGFYVFRAMLNGKMGIHIIYDNKNIPQKLHSSPTIVPMTIQKIFREIMSGKILLDEPNAMGGGV